ncbi:hypothetical protein BH09BAC5_BH09BAC5_23150 [soil metagenome]
MKKSFKIKIRLFALVSPLFIFLLFLFSCNNGATKTDKMDGMDMSGNSSMNSVSDENNILSDSIVISNQLTIHPSYEKKKISIAVNGIVRIDDRRTNSVSAYFGGRIEKLYVKYNNQYITKGQHIMDVYSPELITAQENYLFLLKNSAEKNLAKKAKDQLSLFGLSLEQISQIEKTGNAFYSLPVYSNYEGYILFGELNKSQTSSTLSNGNTGMQGGMNMGSESKSGTATNSENSESGLTVGMYVNKGQKLFSVNDHKSVWVQLSIEDKDAASIKLNDGVIITTDIFPNNHLDGKIDFMEPVINDNQRFVSLRVYVDNTGKLLKTNSLVNAVIEIKSDSALWVPSSTILNLGKRKMVWLKTGVYGKGKGTFIVKEVKIGKVTGQFTEIISGLSEKDEIVKTAGFMSDSEALIR